MKSALIVLSILLLATFAATEWQWQQNTREELRETSSTNDELQWMFMKYTAQMNRDSQEISTLEAKVNELASPHTPASDH